MDGWARIEEAAGSRSGDVSMYGFMTACSPLILLLLEALIVLCVTRSSWGCPESLKISTELVPAALA